MAGRCRTNNMGLNILAYPDYLLFKHRVVSFKSWPPQLSQKNTDLANAGFFYSNVSDRVTCFACGVRLYGWKIRDDPWIEHYKNAKHCLYLNMVGGVRIVEPKHGGTDIRAKPTPRHGTHDRTGTDESDDVRSVERSMIQLDNK